MRSWFSPFDRSPNGYAHSKTPAALSVNISPSRIYRASIASEAWPVCCRIFQDDTPAAAALVASPARKPVLPDAAMSGHRSANWGLGDPNGKANNGTQDVGKWGFVISGRPKMVSPPWRSTALTIASPPAMYSPMDQPPRPYVTLDLYCLGSVEHRSGDTKGGQH